MENLKNLLLKAYQTRDPSVEIFAAIPLALRKRFYRFVEMCEYLNPTGNIDVQFIALLVSQFEC